LWLRATSADARQLVVDEQLAVEDELADAPAVDGVRDDPHAYNRAR
jgi:hypothetical protein